MLNRSSKWSVLEVKLPPKLAVETHALVIMTCYCICCMGTTYRPGMKKSCHSHDSSICFGLTLLSDRYALMKHVIYLCQGKKLSFKDEKETLLVPLQWSSWLKVLNKQNPFMSHSSIKNPFWSNRTESATTLKQRGLHPPLKLSCKSLMQSVNKQTMVAATGVSLSNHG